MTDCIEPARTKGMCGKHYVRWKRHGDPLTVLLRKDLSPEERYEAKVDRLTTPDGCHPWTGTSWQGYGKFQQSSRKSVAAHRWGYERYIGPIPPGLQVRHTCDNPPCQNRDHWLVGTLQQNMTDRQERGRHASKLTIRDVREIRQQYDTGEWTQTALALEFGVHPSNISNIISRRYWKHIT